MDIRRIFIFAGLALSSYMLFYTWDQDYGSAAKKASSAPETVVTETASDTPVVTDADAAVSPMSGDVPDVTDVNEQPQIPASDSQTSAVSGQLVKVETDTLKVVIDLKGGQIIDARLKQYPESLDHPDVPFALLETSQIRNYVAQSGLLGPDGVDKNGGALYTAEQTEYSLGDDDTLQVVLTTSTDKADVKKIYTFHRGQYLTDVNYRVTNKSQEPWKGVLEGLRDALGKPLRKACRTSWKTLRA